LNESERCGTLKQNSEAEIRKIGIKGEPRGESWAFRSRFLN
jgi:hypothetical protein